MLKQLSLAGAIVLSTSAVVFTTSQTAAPAGPPKGGPHRGARDWGSDAQLATIKQYCAGCHNDRMKSAGVSFDGLTAESIGKHPDVFEKAVRKLRGRVMPPPNARQPDGATV